MKTTCTFFLGLLVAFMIATPTTAVQPVADDFAAVDEFIQSYQVRNHIPGVSLAVTQGDQLVYSRGYGTAGPNRPMTGDTPMLIGSQSKSFTALAVMQLVEAGKIDLDAPIQNYIPWFEVADRQASAQINVRSLLNHTSGLSEAGYASNLPNRTTLEEAVRDLQRARSYAGVGMKHQYFNPGYTTLGYLVEVISGQTYAQYLRQHVFEPLGMAHSSAAMDEYDSLGLAQGYTQLFGFPFPMRQPLPHYYLPAGFIVSTTNDLARYLIAMGQGGELDGVRILSEASVRQMFTPSNSASSTAGFGWDINRYYGETQVTHGGATERFYTSVVILPERGLSVAMIINQDHMFRATYDYLPLFWGVVDLLTGHPVTNQGISGVTIGWGLLAGFLVAIFFSVRGLLALPKESYRLAHQPAGHGWFSILPHAVSMMVTLFLVTFAGPSLAGRGFELRWFIGFYPDVALLAGVVLTAEAIQLIAKAAATITPQFTKTQFR